ncbi:hypothetical protein [Roseicella sp. DB1501]|uniref:hypothetical protein n=1 Tax=Roseicella sp. DB1501 TaxID=2730925 RepID=UPI001490BB42|nr:hypothetical protein [Roseicella sp. DB1501]NOG73754.1 hypothetical protein [Roseicella sp. DB1501]
MGLIVTLGTDFPSPEAGWKKLLLRFDEGPGAKAIVEWRASFSNYGHDVSLGRSTDHSCPAGGVTTVRDTIATC